MKVIFAPLFRTLRKEDKRTDKGSLRDLIGNAPIKDVAQASMAVITALQQHPNKGVQLLGICSAFIILCEDSGIPVQDIIGFSKNCINFAEGRKPEFLAVDEYITKEIFK